MPESLSATHTIWSRDPVGIDRTLVGAKGANPRTAGQRRRSGAVRVNDLLSTGRDQLRRRALERGRDRAALRMHPRGRQTHRRQGDL
jgi:hypothetical protein